MGPPKLSSDTRGVSALEFAIAAPALLVLILGIAQLGILFLANAGLRSSVAEGARHAIIYPRPTDAEIRAKALENTFGMDSAYLSGPTLVHGTSDGVSYIDIRMDYAMPLQFVFFETPPIQLSVTRRAFVNPAA